MNKTESFQVWPNGVWMAMREFPPHKGWNPYKTFWMDDNVTRSELDMAKTWLAQFKSIRENVGALRATDVCWGLTRTSKQSYYFDLPCYYKQAGFCAIRGEAVS